MNFTETWNELLATAHMTQAQRAVETAVARNKIQPYVARHMARVAFNTAVLAYKSDLKFDEITNVTTGAMLHDLGKCKLVEASNAGNFTSTTLGELKRHHPLISLKQVLKIQGISHHPVIPAQVALHHTHFTNKDRNYPESQEINELLESGMLHYSGVAESRYTGPLLAQSDAFDAFLNCTDPSRLVYMADEQTMTNEERLYKAQLAVQKDIVPTHLAPNVSAELIMMHLHDARTFANQLVT